MQQSRCCIHAASGYDGWQAVFDDTCRVVARTIHSTATTPHEPTADKYFLTTQPQRTGGTARFWSGVSALGFLRRTSLIEYTPEGLARDAAVIDTLATAEYLDAHARSATIRTQ